jgi:hypothetical protein
MDGGDTLDMINHRPISILNGLSKMFEAVLKNILEIHFMIRRN